MRIFKTIELDRLRPGIWRVHWERHDTGGWTDEVTVTGPVHSVAKAVPVMLGLSRARSAAEAAERIRQLARQQGWPEPDIEMHPPKPEDPA